TTITLDQNHKIIDINFELTPESKELNAVVVSAKAKGMVGKDSFTFDKQQIKKARVLQDLVFCLPEFKKDVRTGNITSAHGGSAPLILLNGIISSNEELKTIPPQKIIRIDRYDLPPERFNVQGPVIDVITASLDTGYNGGFDANIAPLATDAYAKGYYGYNVGKHRFNLFTNLFIRDTHKGREQEQQLAYTADKEYKFVNDKIDKFKYTSSNLKLSYTYREPSKYTFQASLSGNYEYHKSRVNQDGHAYHNTVDPDRKGLTKFKSNSFVPVLDLYFDYTFNENSRLYSNVVMTSNIVTQHMNELERGLQTNSIYIDDYLDADNDKISLIAQIEYQHGFRGVNVSVGTQGMYSNADFNISGGSIGPKTSDKQKQFNNRSYVTLSGLIGKLQYYLSPSFAVVNISSHKGKDQSETKYYFRPQLSLMYRMPRGHSLRLDLIGMNNVPGLSMTANVLRKVKEGFYYRNNPGLKNSYIFDSKLQYRFISKLIYFDSYFEYYRSNKEIITGFINEEINGANAIVQRPENSRYMQLINFGASVTLKPFMDERLSIRLYGNPFNRTYSYESGFKKSYFSFKSGGSVEYNINNFSFNLGMTLPYKAMKSYFMEDNKFFSEFGASYRYKNWGFNFSLQNMFVREKFTSENLPHIPMKEILNTTERDNYWKMGFGISYYFSSGKSYRASKELENEDSDGVKI
ncbi:MAG: hypothetical protein Q4A76_06375, partial [Porphyromonadaceae bacterium]|nr:hypothetical protein [Porphyromonadaceae bacterium]